MSASARVHRVLVPGVWDLLNVGHYHYIQQAKQLFRNTEVVIGVMDPVQEMKFVGMTAMSFEERTASIHHVKYVDEVIAPCPWILTPQFLDEHKIDVVVDNQFFPGYKYYRKMFKQIEKAGRLRKMKRMEVPKSHEYLRRVLFDCDLYIMRSIERGYKLEDLGIGYIRYKYLQMRSYVDVFMRGFLGGRCMRRKNAKT